MIFLNFDLFKKYNIDNIKVLKILLKTTKKYIVYIKKKQFKLFIINSDRDIVKIFDIAVGKKEDFLPKIHSGDNGTPEGLYFVKEILSRDSGKSTYSYKKLRSMNYVYFKASEGHYLWGVPHKDAGRNVYGIRFFRLDYPNQKDNKNYLKLKRKGLIPKNKEGKQVGQGTGIGIHGTNDPLSIRHRISSGCIRMNNDDVKLLDKYLKIGTPVYIEQ